MGEGLLPRGCGYSNSVNREQTMRMRMASVTLGRSIDAKHLHVTNLGFSMMMMKRDGDIDH